MTCAVSQSTHALMVDYLGCAEESNCCKPSMLATSTAPRAIRTARKCLGRDDHVRQLSNSMDGALAVSLRAHGLACLKGFRS